MRAGSWTCCPTLREVRPELHREKTRLVPFSSPNRSSQLEPPPDTFDFLGFTHYWGTTRKGLWAIKRKTASKRMSRALRRISEWCREHMHDPLVAQYQSLVRKLRGHYAFYGITGNADSLKRFRYAVKGIWFQWLSRRSRRRMSWRRFTEVLARWPLPNAIAIHSVLRPANP